MTSRAGAPSRTGAGPARTAWWHTVLIGALVVLLFPVLLVLLLIYAIYVVALYAAIWGSWLPRGRDVLFAYSNSPVWQDRVEREILPLIGHRAIVLNWSERARWRTTLATLAFRHFGGDRSFNPLAVVFRPFRRARVFRFWQPFRDWKHGRGEPLAQMEREFLTALGIEKRHHPAA